MDLVGELVLTRNQILQFNIEREDPGPECDLTTAEPDYHRVAGRRDEDAHATHRGGVEQVAAGGARHGDALGKQIRLQMDGADTELDRTIIEAIKDPLTHLIRNSVRPRYRSAGGQRWPAGKSPQGDAHPARLSRRRPGQYRNRR